MYDNISVDNILNQKADWLESKNKFRLFLVDELHIVDEAILNRLLEEYDEGLNANIDFRMLMFALGFDEQYVDAIINRFNNGEKPKSKEDNIVIKDSSIIEEVQNQLSKIRLDYKLKSYDSQRLEEFRKKAEEILINVKPINLNETYEDVKVDLLIGDKITINNDAILYSDGLSLTTSRNGCIPYYDGATPREVVAILCSYNDDNIVLQDDFAVSSIVSAGANIIGVLTSINGKTECFYKVDDVIKRGVTR